MTITASLIGLGTVSSNFTAINNIGNYWRDWEAKSLLFVADSTTLTLKFAYNGPYDVGLDNISINSVGPIVPEPSTFALIGLGIALLASRRRLR